MQYGLMGPAWCDSSRARSPRSRANDLREPESFRQAGKQLGKCYPSTCCHAANPCHKILSSELNSSRTHYWCRYFPPLRLIIALSHPIKFAWCCIAASGKRLPRPLTEYACLMLVLRQASLHVFDRVLDVRVTKMPLHKGVSMQGCHNTKMSLHRDVRDVTA